MFSSEEELTEYLSIPNRQVKNKKFDIHMYSNGEGGICYTGDWFNIDFIQSEPTYEDWEIADLLP